MIVRTVNPFQISAYEDIAKYISSLLVYASHIVLNLPIPGCRLPNGRGGANGPACTISLGRKGEKEFLLTREGYQADQN